MAYYFDENPTCDSHENLIKVFINGIRFCFYTDNDVFSKKGLDFGTRTLLESIDLSEINGKVLDLGCGYGPIGIYLAYNKKNVDMIDINNRAIELSKKNSKINNVDVNVFKSNMYENVHEKYDYIISNPPIRVGKEILYDLLFNATDYLNKNGHLVIVVNKNQGAKSLIKKLEEKYIVKIIAKNKGFFVIDCQNH